MSSIRERSHITRAINMNMEALNMIDEGFQQFFGFDSKFINAMPLEYLLGMLRQGEVLCLCHGCQKAAK